MFIYHISGRLKDNVLEKNEIDIGDLNRRNRDGRKMKVDMRMAEFTYIRAVKGQRYVLWRINELDIGDLNRRNHDGGR